MVFRELLRRFQEGVDEKSGFARRTGRFTVHIRNILNIASVLCHHFQNNDF